jgi:hypothetical protein
LTGCCFSLSLFEKIKRAAERTMIKKRRKTMIAEKSIKNVTTSLVIFSPVPEYFGQVNAIYKVAAKNPMGQYRSKKYPMHNTTNLRLR